MDTQDTSPSVLRFFDNQRFIFNAGEGLQRFCTEHKTKLSKIDHIFFSRVCSETAGGLPGLFIDVSAMMLINSIHTYLRAKIRLAVDFGWHGERGNFFADVLKVNIWDPSDLKYLIDAMKSFIPNAAMVIKPSFQPMLSSIGTTMADQSGFTYSIVLIDDEIVKISAILLQPSSPEESQPLNEELMMQYTSEEVLKQRMAHILNPINPKSKASAGKLCDMSVVYVCELPEIKGKFDPAKAVAFGLKPGPKYRELQLGNSVKSDLQNIMVHPSDVMGPSVPGPIVLLVDCPTESHLQELLSVQCLDSYYADFSGTPESSKVVTCIIHLSPASIVSTSNYQKWMERFGAAQHIMAGHERKNVEIPILKSTARITARLNYLCPQFFPASGFLSLRHLDCSEPGAIVSSEGSVLKLCKSISAKNLLKATFEDDMLDEAIARHHSTTKEAIEVGNSCRAYRIILTHFSQRYPKIPEFDETHMHNTCIAFDMMSVNIADLPVLPKVLPFFKLLFRNETMLDDSDDITDTVNDES
ncbi:tRNAse Z TRZ4, mitochondrial isoform X4 [Ziziphus jujuba]|uniref:ribonuclease Z n=2 Tax=Ziziphus jujuba TaxID=326968 RepID=A0ABM4A419_ZIZJJ|nr:tRNAse Z TRZ4, mitochondrial isoform X4 [Ziziphus jujuba]XP_060671479.1 tRNAse Z TRZ4, mitochondrial isoform X4 [Ziziphus jujuba]